MGLAVFMFISGGGVVLKRSDTISRRPREAAIMSAVSPLRGWRASMTATLRVESHLDTTLRSSDATATRMRVDMATTPPRGGGCRRTTLTSGAKTSKAAREATDHIRRDRALEGTRMVLATCLECGNCVSRTRLLGASSCWKCELLQYCRQGVEPSPRLRWAVAGGAPAILGRPLRGSYK